MSCLQFDGMEVRHSCLNHKAYKASPCRFLLPVTAQNKDQMLAEFRRTGEFGSYSGLWVSGIEDLGFLQEFPDLLYLEVVDQPRVNTRQLKGLRNLRGLRIESPGAGIDLAWFPELEIFSGDWHIENCNLGQCRELRTLMLRQFNPPSSDLSDLAQAVRLETLDLTRTNISSLGGLESLEDLRYLDIAYAPKLVSLDAFSVGNCGVREFSLRNAKKVSSYRPLASASYLRRLRLSSCAPMADLTWTRGMNRLDSLSFVETNVENGDLSPLLELPMLRYVGTMDKKHYNYRFERINELLEERGRSSAGNCTSG